MARITNKQIFEFLEKQKVFTDAMYVEMLFNQRVIRRLSELSGMTRDDFIDFIQETRKEMEDDFWVNGELSKLDINK